MAIAHPINTAGEFETREPDSPFVIRESYFVCLVGTTFALNATA